MKILQFHTRIKKFVKNIEFLLKIKKIKEFNTKFHARITKIMKILELSLRIMKIMKILKFQNENHENHENFILQCEKFENQINLKILVENHENH